MSRPTDPRGWVLVALLTVSLALYWAVDTGSTALQALLLGSVAGLSMLAVWMWR